MVGHDNEVAHSVPVAVEMKERFGNDQRKVWSPEQTSAVAGVEKLLFATIERR